MNTKNLIIKETEKQIFERGINSVSVRSITNGINHNVATISYHFKTKENLFCTILKHNLGHLAQYASNESHCTADRKNIEDIYIVIKYFRLYPERASAISEIAKHAVKEYDNQALDDLSSYIDNLFNKDHQSFSSSILPRSFKMLENLSLISDIVNFTLGDKKVTTIDLSPRELYSLSKATYQIYKFRVNCSVTENDFEITV